MTPWTTRALAQQIGATHRGEERAVMGLCPPEAPREGHLQVAPDAGAVRAALDAPGVDRLAALVHPPGLDEGTQPPRLVHSEPRLAFARLTRIFADEPRPAVGVAPGASVHPEARLEGGVSVAAGAYVDAGAELGAGTSVGPGAIIGAGCTVGPDGRLYAGVVLYPGVRLGARVRVHAGAVLGADGFGYAAGPEGPEKIHHLAGLRVGDDVEIGANACIDRGILTDGTIGDGTKIDNLCQIGHNVHIGRGCMIAGMVGIGGSTVLEDGVVIGGGAGLSDHLRIGRGARLAARAGVSKDVPAGEAWGGVPAVPMRTWVRERYLISRLERIWAFVRTRKDDT